MSLCFNSVIPGYHYNIIDYPTYLAYHAFTNISIGFLWCLCGTIIIWTLNPESVSSVSKVSLISLAFSIATTIIAAIDAAWYTFAIVDHVEKEFVVSIAFLYVNLILSASLISITQSFKLSMTSVNVHTEFMAASIKSDEVNN